MLLHSLLALQRVRASVIIDLLLSYPGDPKDLDKSKLRS